MLYTLPTHNIQMQTPLCADIMSYYKKKNPRGWIFPIQQANGIDHCTPSTRHFYAQRRLQSQRAERLTRMFQDMLPKT